MLCKQLEVSFPTGQCAAAKLFHPVLAMPGTAGVSKAAQSARGVDRQSPAERGRRGIIGAPIISLLSLVSPAARAAALAACQLPGLVASDEDGASAIQQLSALVAARTPCAKLLLPARNIMRVINLLEHSLLNPLLMYALLASFDTLIVKSDAGSLAGDGSSGWGSAGDGPSGARTNLFVALGIFVAIIGVPVMYFLEGAVSSDGCCSRGRSIWVRALTMSDYASSLRSGHGALDAAWSRAIRKENTTPLARLASFWVSRLNRSNSSTGS